MNYSANDEPTWTLAGRRKRGEHLGRNALKVRDKRLRLTWRWSFHPVKYDGLRCTEWKRCPGQCSEAKLGGGLKLKVTDWHDHYDAELIGGDEILIGTNGFGVREAQDDEESLKTRIDAQIRAERLVQELIDFLRVNAPEVTESAA